MKNWFTLKYSDTWYLIDDGIYSKKHYSVASLLTLLGSKDKLFSLQVSEVIGGIELERDFDKCPHIINIESFSKQFLQKSKILEPSRKWNIHQLLIEKDILPVGFRINEDSIFEYLIHIRSFISMTLDQFGPEELNRFETIELPINRIIYQRQRKGLSVNRDIVPEIIESLEAEFYEVKNQLQLNHGIFSPDSRNEQFRWLKENDIEVKGSLRQTFKNHSSRNTICELIYRMYRLKGDLDCLIYLSVAKGNNPRVVPSFIGFGTITSRIMLREPALQNIRKKYRKVIIPDENCEFIYIDYAQFEAGILASLSKDPKLIDLHDTGDIYTDIATKVYSKSANRDEAKILFYRYMYGDEKMSLREKTYFRSFTTLSQYKLALEAESKNTGKIGTELGNYRMLDEKDVYLGISHKIQSTASLILKKAIIKVNKQVSQVQFILPMHDAVLYQVNTQINDIRIAERKIIKIFEEVYSSVCPGITTVAKAKSFFED
jgi:DNA polymerase I-like protein with 3'-5' exonuclease and polymerase domains